MAGGLAGEVRGDSERVDGDHWIWRAWIGSNRLWGWFPKGGAASDCARASGGGESLGQVVVTLEGNGPRLLDWGPEVEEEGAGGWIWEGWWYL